MKTQFKPIAEMTTAEMLEEYNRLTGKQTAKFASREKGMKQLENARNEHDAGSTATAEQVEDASTATEVKPKDPATAKEQHERRSASISNSWNVVEIAEKRKQRNGVSVTLPDGSTQEHNSVLKAFQALNLDEKKHIRFRVTIKASGKESYEENGKTYVFDLKEAVKPEPKAPKQPKAPKEPKAKKVKPQKEAETQQPESQPEALAA